MLLHRPERSPVTISLAFLLMAVLIWGIPQIAINWLDLQGEIYDKVVRFSALGYVAVPAIFLFFSLAFVKNISLFRNILIFGYTFFPMILFLFLSWTTNLIVNYHPSAIVTNEWGYNSPPGEYFWLYLLWLESLLIASIGVLIIYFRQSTNSIYRIQALMLIFAVLIPIICGTITDGILPLFSIHSFPSAVPLTAVMGIIISYAIMKYELFDLAPATILSSIGDGLITVNQKSRIIEANSAALETLGVFEKKDLIGKNICSFLNSDRANIGEKLKDAIETGEKFSASHVNFCIGQREIPTAMTVTPVTIEGKTAGATILFRDISLEIKREMSRDDFINVASHELKTPITSVKLYTDVLRKKLKQSDGTYDRYVEKLSEQVNRVVVLSNDLLDFANIKSGKVILNREEFDLNTLVKDVIRTVNVGTKKRKIRVEKSLKQQIYADKNRIGQVVTNLITNALKYSPSGSEIIVTITQEANYAKVSVQDFGSGISKQEQKKIFDRLYRVKSGEKNQGLGIGLYIASNIIKQHQGQIGVDSKLGKGSTFYFTIPLV